MGKFALVVQNQFGFTGEEKGIPAGIWSGLYSRLPAFGGGRFTGLKDQQGEAIAGELICQPGVFAQPAQTQDFTAQALSAQQQKRAAQIWKLAREKEAFILGVGESDYAVFPDNAEVCPKGITLVTGAAYQSILIRQLLRQICAERKQSLAQIQVVLTGAEESFGRVCAQVLAQEVRNLTLTHMAERSFEALAARLLYQTGMPLRLGRDVIKALQQADVVIKTGINQPAWDDREWAQIKPGALVIEVHSRNPAQTVLARSKRSDLRQVEQLLVTTPMNLEFQSHWLLPGLLHGFTETWPAWLRKLAAKDLDAQKPIKLPAALAESIILALDPKLPLPKEGDLPVTYINQLEQASLKLGFRFCLPEQIRSVA